MAAEIILPKLGMNTEAATIVRELALRVVHGAIPGVPSLQVVRLCPSGAITVEGPVAADEHDACVRREVEPGIEVAVRLVRIGGRRVVAGLRGEVAGPLDAAGGS